MVKPAQDQSIAELLGAIPDIKGEPWRLPDKTRDEMRVDRVLPGGNTDDDE